MIEQITREHNTSFFHFQLGFRMHLVLLCIYGVQILIKQAKKKKWCWFAENGQIFIAKILKEKAQRSIYIYIYIPKKDLSSSTFKLCTNFQYHVSHMKLCRVLKPNVWIPPMVSCLFFYLQFKISCMLEPIFREIVFS